ncbi:MAG: hypothetical protein JST21_06800 [Bacteroidetes bacterium]|nr:hypothetical protein [Bacteroidota bacterium]
MKYFADNFLENGIPVTDAEWANLSCQYNTEIHSGIYDGYMFLGNGFLQPDKAGAFGFDLLHLYKITIETQYLDAAIKIANTLAERVQPVDRKLKIKPGNCKRIYLLYSFKKFEHAYCSL